MSKKRTLKILEHKNSEEEQGGKLEKQYVTYEKTFYQTIGKTTFNLAQLKKKHTKHH